MAHKPGKGFTGRRHTEQTKLSIAMKNSIALRGRPKSKIHRDRISVALKGGQHSSEHRANNAAARRGRKHSKGCRHCQVSKEQAKKRFGPQKGRKFSLERNAKISASLKTSPRAAEARRNIGRLRPTSIEMVLFSLLEHAGYQICKYKAFGKYVVDAYVPLPYHLAFEADGEYWHSPKADERRDIALSEWGLVVVHLGELELKEIGKGLEKFAYT